ncbi:MAG: hypothetical protein IPM36_09155 [Lewinellaceae bacterium]|nr:hypothetical protein [Lewinellaceae bacterium]
MKPYVFKVSAIVLLLGALWACQKDNDPPAPGAAVTVPKWDVQTTRNLLYEVEFKGYTKGELAQTRTTTLELFFKGAGRVTVVFGDAATKQEFIMDSTGLLSPVVPGQPYSPILDLFTVLPADGVAAAAVGSHWDVLAPSEKQVAANADACIIQSRRTFKVLSADANSIKMQHDGYLRVVDNKAAATNFETMFGTAGGALARQAWTQWRLFQTGETVFSTSDNNLKLASYVAVILPGANMDDAALRASPEREELTIRRRP